MRLPLTIVICCLSSALLAQTPLPSRSEKAWAILHPFAALKVNRIAKKCNTLLKQTPLSFPLPDFENGGRPDAFRHVFYMAAFAQKVGAKKIRKLGIAHEKTNYKNYLKQRLEHGELADSLSSVMDLKNNELGIGIGCQNKELNLPGLKELVLTELTDGKAFIMKRKKNGVYLTGENKPIELKDYQGHWFIPKCLVPSNTPYVD